MSAIQEYFVNARKVAKRREEWVQKKIEEMENPPVIEEVYSCEEEFSEFDSLLCRNWFLTNEDIIDLVWEASEDAFMKIMDNLHRYPKNVQEVLLYSFNPPTFSNKTLKLKNLTDEDMFQMYKAEQQRLEKLLDEEWNKHKKETGVTRPLGDVDEKYTDLYDELQRAKKKLEDVSKVYVSPSLKKQGNTESDKAKENIKRIENEIVQVKKEIEQEEKKWEDDRKFNFQTKFYQMLPL